MRWMAIRMRARFGVIRIALGEQAYAALAPAALRALVSDALTIDTIMRNAVAENSLNPHNIESVICKGILPLLYGTLGLDIAKAVVEQVIHMTRVGLGRR